MVAVHVSPQLFQAVNRLNSNEEDTEGQSLLKSLSILEQKIVKKYVIDKAEASQADVQWF
jgi:hypothetical protein